MNPVPLVLLHRDHTCSNCRWDEALPYDLICGTQKQPWNLRPVVESEVKEYDYAIVMFPAGAHEPSDVDWLNEQLQRIGRVILFLTSDETSGFPIERIKHPNILFWVSTPNAQIRHYNDDTEFFVEGSGRAWATADPETPKTLLWQFAGQVNHEDRRRARDAMLRMRPAVKGKATFTDAFLSGMTRGEYLAEVASAKMVMCPAGIATQSTFRLVEALELGALPIRPHKRQDGTGGGYWDLVMPGCPAPIVDTWVELHALVPKERDRWPENVIAAHGWWHDWRRKMAQRLAQQMNWLTQEPPDPRGLTVVIPTSPIPSHPSLDVISETIASVRERTDAEILITCDGIREEQTGRRQDYLEFQRKLLLACERWFNVTPMIFPHHMHQAEMLRAALYFEIDSPYVMYVEHDTPLIGDFEWWEIWRRIEQYELNVLRFHHEASVLDVHKHLMIGKPESHIWRTMQFSQRPHIARTKWYMDMLDRYFDPTARTFIEDVLHGVQTVELDTKGPKAWEKWRTAIWHPEGDIKRSTHTDGRGGDPKYGNRYRYPDDGLPLGAPNPQAGLQ